MTTRRFDPVLSAALRNELETLADRVEEPRRPRPALARPQVWVTVATALVLVLATVGVLRLTGGEGTPPAGGGDALVDPMLAAGGPLRDESVRSTPVDVLAQLRGRGTTRLEVDVPARTSRLLIYVTCAPTSRLAVADDGSDRSFFSGTCAAGTATADVTGRPSAGSRSIEIRVPEATRVAVLVLAIAPTSTTTLSTLQVTESPAAVSD